MSFIVAHITDTHLSGERPYFNENFAIVAAALRDDAPDLVVNTGDVSLNGADSGDDLVAAHALHEALDLPWLAIPGNHDLGDNQEIAKKQPADAARRARWLEVFGPDWWTRDVPGWRLLGINSLLLGSDMGDAADAQEAFVADAVRNLEGRSLALFLHKPLFLDGLDDQELSSHAVNAGPRARLLAALGENLPRLVCCGHLHEHRERAHAGIHQVWAPAVSFTIPDWFIAPHGGVHTVGYVRIELDADGGFKTRFMQPEGLIVHDLADFPQAYGDLRAMNPHAAT